MAYRRKIAIGRMLTVAFIFSLCSNTGAALDPNEVIKSIRRDERRLINIRVEAEFREETQDAQNNWQPTAKTAHVKAWFEGVAGGRVRVDMINEILVSAEDHSQFVNSYSASFDGKSGTMIRLKGGMVGHTGVPTESQITAGYPSSLASASVAMVTGARFSSPLHDFIRAKSLSDLLEEQATFNGTVAGTYDLAEATDFHGTKAIKLSMGKKGLIEQTWWLDPARGNSLLGDEVRSGVQNVVMGHSQVVMLSEVAPQLWYPQEAYYYFPAEPAKAARRVHYKASKIVANDPNFDESIFSLKIPPGYTVDDKINHKIYQSAPTTRDLEKDLDKAIDDAMRLSTPTTRPAGDPTSQGSDARPVRAGLPGIFGLVSAGSLGLVLRGKMRGVGILLASIILGSLSAVTQVRASPVVDASINQSAPTTTWLNHGAVMKIHDRPCSSWINFQQFPLECGYLGGDANQRRQFT